MATPLTIDEAVIRQQIDTLAEAIRSMDIETVMSIYAPDMVSFDIVPPLEHIGSAAKRKNWVEAFAIYERPIDYEIRDLTVTVGDDVAFGHSLNLISGTLKDGTRTGFSLRATTCWRVIDGNWLITHDQASVPLDLASGKALLNLEP
jgi:ketosteroid isomerase-like protein